MRLLFQRLIPRRATALFSLTLVALMACSDSTGVTPGEPTLVGKIVAAEPQGPDFVVLTVQSEPFPDACENNRAVVSASSNLTQVSWSSGEYASLGDLSVDRDVMVWTTGGLMSCPPQMGATIIIIER